MGILEYWVANPSLHYSNTPVLLLFHAYILLEIISARIVAFEGPRDSFSVPTAGKALFQKRDHQIPGIVRGFSAVPPRHRIVQPPVWSVTIQADMITLFGPFQTVTKPDHIIHRDDMIRLAKDPQDRARYSRDEVLDEGGPKLIALPFLSTDRAVEYDNSGDIISIRCEE